MSIHTILSQMEESFDKEFGARHTELTKRIILFFRSFATRIVEEISEDTKHMEVPIHPDFPKDVLWSIGSYALYCRGFHRALRDLRIKLQKMKGGK